MPSRFQCALTVRAGAVHPTVTRNGASLLLGTEVPIEDESLTLGVAGHAFPVPAELGIVGREELEPGQRPLAELVDHAPVAEDALDLPVGGQGTEVDDPHMSLGRLGLQLFR